MIAVLKKGTTQAQTEHLIQWLRNMNLDVHMSAGQEVTILGLVGDTSRVDIELLSSLEIVDSVKRVSEPCRGQIMLYLVLDPNNRLCSRLTEKLRRQTT